MAKIPLARLTSNVLVVVVVLSWAARPTWDVSGGPSHSNLCAS
jgi:hypothetical protein